MSGTTYNLFLLLVSIILISYAVRYYIKANELKEQKHLSEVTQIEQLKRQFEGVEKDLSHVNQTLTKTKEQIDQKTESLGILNRQILQKRKQLEQISQKSFENIEVLNRKIKSKQSELEVLTDKEINKRKEIDQFCGKEKEIISKNLEDFKQVSSQAASNYFDNLEKTYSAAELAHKQKMAGLQKEYNEAAADLNNLRETRKAAHEALLKQQEVKQNKDNYRLKPTDVDLQDIHSLERLKKTFHKPRVISMLIWQYYFQPLAKKQFPIILHSNTKTGIYKITNLQTDETYIGQSVDIYKRWTEHCKAGLGIDAPVGNSLYQAMHNIGLQNFTFELICQCSKEELNEKEKYFIQLYGSNVYGYNVQKGNK